MRKAAVILLSALLLSSCSREQAERRLEVGFEVSETHTKAVDEGATAGLDALVFTSDGALYSLSHSDGVTVSASVPKGREVSWHLLSGAPASLLADITDEDEFLSREIKLSDCSEALVMHASDSDTFEDPTGVTANLGRCVSKVLLGSVYADFLATGDYGSSATLERVWLVNVRGGVAVGGPSAGVLWYNRLDRDPGLPAGIAGFLCKDVGLDITDVSRQTLDIPLYCCPNPTEDDVTSLVSNSWSPRRTRLVLEMTLDDGTNYYPVTLPVMACNTCYVVSEVHLLGPGSASPDIPVDRTAISLSVTLSPWGGTETEFELK